MKYPKSKTVKNHSPLIATMLILGLSCFNTTVNADYKPDFSEPPYTVGKTILGVDGWDFRIIDNNSSDNMAFVESVPLKQEKHSIVLENANVKNVMAEPVESERVSIAFSIAVEPAEQARLGRQFRIGFSETAIGEVYFEKGPEGGLGYRGEGDGRTGGVICVPAADFVEGSLYTFLLELDTLSQSYKISVSGETSDGSQLSYIADGVEFISPIEGMIKIRSSYIIVGPHVKGYLGSLAITAE